MGREVVYGMGDGAVLGLEMGEESAKFKWEYRAQG
jgi:hypothetical protein